MTVITMIQGGIASDDRGHIRFVNDFDMTLVRRFYIIKNRDTDLVRGWRAHKIERRWFYVVSGCFKLSSIQIDNWENPSTDLTVEQQTLSANDGKVISVPAGYGTAFQALEPDSELLVFADYPISHAASDNYTWALDYFINFK
ncbi:hypothetical protein ACR78Z_13540 [Sphingobacterium thalpophilum]|uniref:hypothetical protein n=1 Tax=Sphingobacterium thalpophilum TaxID=259 RepID=UPI003DA4A6E4